VSVLAIVLIVLGVVILLVLAGGYVAVRRRARAQEGTFEARLAAADRALEEARADDKGWNRQLLEEAARQAVADARPGWSFDTLHLVLVDDRPGVAEDRAEFLAVGNGEEVRVALARRDGGWTAERIG
jgi:type II secretory pathway pseudopilin PulG